jgi:hypothetical protein
MSTNDESTNADDRRTAGPPADSDDRTTAGPPADSDDRTTAGPPADSDDRTTAGPPADSDDRTATGTPMTRLSSRIFVTWVELVAVGFVGAVVGGVASGPPQLVAYLATVLALVAVFMYNVDVLVRGRLEEAR